jgi:hypothetical protein
MPNHPKPQVKQPAIDFYVPWKQPLCVPAEFFKVRNGVNIPLAPHGLSMGCAAGETVTLPNKDSVNPIKHQL